MWSRAARRDLDGDPDCSGARPVKPEKSPRGLRISTDLKSVNCAISCLTRPASTHVPGVLCLLVPVRHGSGAMVLPIGCLVLPGVAPIRFRSVTEC
jgi:hypothetical protein